MSRRTILSRPRTKMYDANYNIGESYYKGAIDRLDRKYSGRTLSPPRQAPVVPRDILERHQRAFTDDDLPSARRRAEQCITEDNIFDAPRTRRPISTAFEPEDDFDEEIASTLRKVRRSKQRQAKIYDDADFENSVGLNEKTASRILEEEPSSAIVRRRMLKITQSAEDNVDNSNLTKWSSLNTNANETSAAAFRARQSRVRLDDLEDEMAALEERKVARERRAANLRAIVAENAEETEALTSALKSSSSRFSARTEKKSVQF